MTSGKGFLTFVHAVSSLTSLTSLFFRLKIVLNIIGSIWCQSWQCVMDEYRISQFLDYRAICDMTHATKQTVYSSVCFNCTKAFHGWSSAVCCYLHWPQDGAGIQSSISQRQKKYLSVGTDLNTFISPYLKWHVTTLI